MAPLGAQSHRLTFLFNYYYILFRWRVLIFTHLPVPKVLFFFFILPCRYILCFQLLSLSIKLLLFASTNFDVFLLSFFLVDTIPTFFEVAFHHSFFARGLTSLTICILCNLKTILIFIYSLMILPIICFLVLSILSLDIS